jgi:hypothetical protein
MTAYWRNELIGYSIRTLILFLFLLTPRAVLTQVQEKNRTLRPNLVWLNLIPVFDFAWIPITLWQIKRSVRAERVSRGQEDRLNTSTFVVGLISWGVYLGSNVISLVFINDSTPPVDIRYLGLVMLCAWIVYWVKCSRLKNDLLAYPGTIAAVPVVQGQGAVCTSCGTVAYHGDVFCRLCGATIASPTAPAAPVATGVAPSVTESSSLEAAPVAEARESTDQVDASELDADQAKCPFCATPYRANARFCSSCGRPAV